MPLEEVYQYLILHNFFYKITCNTVTSAILFCKQAANFLFFIIIFQKSHSYRSILFSISYNYFSCLGFQLWKKFGKKPFIVFRISLTDWAYKLCNIFTECYIVFRKFIYDSNLIVHYYFLYKAQLLFNITNIIGTIKELKMWTLNVKEKYYNMLKQGTKTIELRLFDDKRKNIKVADIIKFSSISNA